MVIQYNNLTFPKSHAKTRRQEELVLFTGEGDAMSFADHDWLEITTEKRRGALGKHYRVEWCWKCGMVREGPHAEAGNYSYFRYLQAGFPMGVRPGRVEVGGRRLKDDGTINQEPDCILIVTG